MAEFMSEPVVLAAVGFSLACLTFALVAAWTWSRSPLPRKRRSTFVAPGFESSPEVDSPPFPNLLGK